jgi:hypothetical protein
MDGLSHIFLHIGLCSAISRLPEQATIPMQVSMMIPRGDAPYDKKLNLQRGDGNEKVVEFDIGRGVYHLNIDVPKYGCRASSYVTVFPDQNRKIVATLTDGSIPIPQPNFLMDGLAPLSFLYVKPTYVLFDKSVTCGKPIGTPLPSRVDVAFDEGAYYSTMYLDPSVMNTTPVFALRFRMATGLEHYVRIPIHIPTDLDGWPQDDRFNITEDMVDELATEKADTLLCPKIWETSAG